MGGAGQAQGLVEGLLGRRRLDDRARPPIERRNLVDQLALGDVGQAAQDALPFLGLGLGGQLDLVDAHQLLPLLADAVERLEHLRDLALHVATRHQAFEGGARLLVLRSDGEDFLVGLDRLGQVAQRHLEDLRQPVGQRDDLLLGIRQANLAAHDLGEIRPPLGHGVQAIQRDQAVLAIRLGLGHALVGRDGLVDLASFLLVHARQAQQHLDLELAVQHALDLGLDGGRQVGPTAAGLGHAVEVRDDLGIRRVRRAWRGSRHRTSASKFDMRRS